MARETPNQLADQRRSERQDVEAEVTLELPAQSLGAVTDNRSSAGVLLYADQPIQVRVRFDGPDGPEERMGRVVRLQRMGDGRSGLAIEFDD